MSVNLYYFKNKKIWGFIIINFFVGIYISAIRLNFPESLYFDDLYFYAREGLILDFESDGFDVQTFMSVLIIVISIPIVCGQFSKSYLSKRCYVASRYKSFSLFYINEIINIVALCFMLSLFYSFGICLFCSAISNLEIHNSSFLFTYFLSVINSTLLLLAFCLIAIPFCTQNDKAAVLSSIILFLSCMAISYYLPEKYKYFDIITIYFVNTLFQNKEYVSYNSIICYMTTFLIITFAILFGNKYMKKRDTV